MENNTIFIAAEHTVGGRSTYDETGLEQYEPISGFLAFPGQGDDKLVVAGLRSLHGRRYGVVVLHNEELPAQCGLSAQLPQFRVRNAGGDGFLR